MRTERRTAAFALLLAALPLAAVEPGADDVAPRRQVDPEQLEYQAGKLAEDVFKPSEELSPDHAIAFPVDF